MADMDLMKENKSLKQAKEYAIEKCQVVELLACRIQFVSMLMLSTL